MEQNPSLTLFLKESKEDDLLLVSPKLYISNIEIARKPRIKIFGVLFDENFSCRKHIKILENKLPKTISFICWAKHTLNKK